MFECPRCGEKSISIKEKYLLGHWMTRTCPRCQARLGARPIPLAFLYFVYTWNILWFITLYVHSSMKLNPDPIYFLYMIVGWILLDITNLFVIPLGAMKRKA